jgi:hypothetical protein
VLAKRENGHSIQKISNGISVTAVIDEDGCLGMVDGKDDGAVDGCVLCIGWKTTT